ncbi:carbohydrate ABC transporter permease [Blautia massiliensis]|jgi:multiple sugar transport system permease protein|uniref:carbohydrate ABC transporter permease n=1 Tax=Blautia TaxID=572511 RepID=UPI0015706DD8|nr:MULTISPECIES: carbohydrate ABC transporter permease [Blautia]MCC2725966.1 carbohydrate ABC transporter permease [Blautia sp. MSK22_86]NSF56861.1 carbohydrate ABC transporter permease [Blautia massiliensis (ex Durand et al. 2017)]NSK72206.1 carbohydrate ABC transporter permease [Blautia massiliensis (ex Durand et al. 2017)]
MRKKKVKPATVVSYVILTIFALIVLVPFIWFVSTSFDYVKSYSLRFPPRLIPKEFSTFNYKMAFSNVPMLSYLKNTVIIVALSAILNVITSTLAGFALSKGKFPGKKIVLVFILSNMMVPFESKLLPIYSIIRNMGLNNNALGVVLPAVLTNAMYIFFVKTYCDGLPDDLYEAGKVDGAGILTIYGKIYFPLLTPIIATIVVLDAINVWNDLLWPMIVLTKQSSYTVQIGLQMYNSGASGTTHAGTALALSVISIIPLSIIYIFCQKYIVQSIAFSGMKQ